MALIASVLVHWIFFSIVLTAGWAIYRAFAKKGEHRTLPPTELRLNPAFTYRYPHRKCEVCGMAENEWCKDECTAIDLMDYR